MKVKKAEEAKKDSDKQSLEQKRATEAKEDQIVSMQKKIDDFNAQFKELQQQLD
jgi:hypothetical protein